jgi:serine/threonine-protein kinase
MSATTPEILEDFPIDSDLEAGQYVGEYVVDGKLGQGAFGTVFRASHPLIGKVVAIKVLARKFSVDPEMVSRFMAEARAVNQIRHRHIIDIFSFGKLDDGRQYYVMEYLDGETLDARIEREGKLPLAEALPILRGIGRALDAAHAKGIAHRDLKAENVFLGAEPDGSVFPKLLDFGIAKLMAPEDGLKHKTRTGTPIGTPYYMSPEQCRGRDVDHRTDLYAFGVLAYLLLTGKFPFDADDYMSILMRQVTERAAPPSSIAPELPSGIDDAVAWLMQKDAADRPPNLREAVAALETAAEQAGIAASVPSWDLQTGPLGQLGGSPAGFAGRGGAAPGIGSRPPNVASARTSGLPAKLPSSPPRTPSIQNQVTLPVVAATERRSRIGMLAIVGGVLVAASVAVVVLVVTHTPSDGAKPLPKTEPTAPLVVPAPIDSKQKPLEAQTVIITIEGVPDGTEVIAGGMTAGAAPGPVQLPRDTAPMVLTFKVDGYLPASRTVTPDRDQPLTVTLKKKPSTQPTKRPNKDDIIDAFEKKKP